MKPKLSRVLHLEAAIAEAEGLALDNSAGPVALAALHARQLLQPHALDDAGRLNLRHALAVLLDLSEALRGIAGPADAAALWALNERLSAGVADLADARERDAAGLPRASRELPAFTGAALG